MQEAFLRETQTPPSSRRLSRIGWRNCWFQGRNVRRTPLNAAMENSGLIKKARSFSGSVRVPVRVVASPITRTASQAAMVTHIHGTTKAFGEAILQLGGAPLLVGGIPTYWHKARRTCDRARIPGMIRKVASKDLGLVGGEKHVVSRSILREDWNLTLGLHAARVRAPAALRVLIELVPPRFSRQIFWRCCVWQPPGVRPPCGSL